MSNNRKTLFISDLHLAENRPEITHIFIRFMENLTAEIDSIYILGDLFETWIGDDDQSYFNRDVIQALSHATAKGFPIYFLHGNRDFLIGKKFLKQTGCQLLSAETKIKLYGTTVLLMHGDTLCTDDIAFMKARKRSSNRFLQFLFLLLPLAVRKKIANNMRMRSKNHIQSISAQMMDINQTALEKVMQKHDAQFIIHGHTHKPCIHNFTYKSNSMTRIVLGSWEESGHVLIWDVNGKKELIHFDTFGK